MFQFNQTHVFNTLTDELSGLAKVTGTAPVAANEDSGTAAASGILNILRVNKFLTDNICAAYKKEATDPVIGSATITMVNKGAGYYRVLFYVRLSGSQNSYYSNDFVFKGKPFAYEFKVAAGDTPATMATNAKAVIDKMQAFYGDKWIKASVSGNNLVLTGTDEYQLFTDARLQMLNETADSALTNVVYEDVDTTVTIVKSVEGFGTFTHLTKDLKLPTIEHLAWEAHDKEELPIPGAKYNLYIINYKVDRGDFGGAAVGQQVTSKVYHAFYVNQAVSSTFESACTTAGITFADYKA